MREMRPLTVARAGVYLAAAAAVGSAWLAQRGGLPLADAVMRSVFVFVIVTVLAFGAEAVLTVGVTPRPPAEPPSSPKGDDE